MEDLSLHVLDVVENSIRAGARNVRIRFSLAAERELLVVEIEDDGKGMDEATLTGAANPYFTTMKGKRFGLGIPLLAQAAEETGGNVRVWSKPNQGTRITATFHMDHVDMKPLGDMDRTLTLLQDTNPDVHFTFDCIEIPSESKIPSD